MRFRKRKEEDVNLGIAPLIDIVFLLLIFFMVTSHFDVASGVRIRLPRVAQKIIDQKDQRITLVMAESGQAYLEGDAVDMTVLEQKLKELVQEKGLLHLVLQADKEVRHGTVVQAMDIAKTAGVKSIIIAAHWKPKKAL
ncbi:MAG: ExbD/TolR family protein [Desulfatiglandales bacterium]